MPVFHGSDFQLQLHLTQPRWNIPSSLCFIDYMVIDLKMLVRETVIDNLNLCKQELFNF